MTLIERLLAMYSHRGDGIPTQYVNPDGPEAAKTLAKRDTRIAELEGALGILNWLEADKPENLANMVASISAAALSGVAMPSPGEQKEMRDDDWINLAALHLGRWPHE